jgi:ribosomal protein S18 acetylase RimI-like enzyme
MTNRKERAVPKPLKSPFEIRAATREDAGFILSLAPRFVGFALPRGRRKRETLAGIHADIERALRESAPTDHFFVAEETGAERARVGFLHLQVQRDFFSGARVCHISDFAVGTGQDGRGIGRALLAHAETWACGHRCKALTLAVFPGNARARALYERAGFEPELLRMAKPVGRRRSPDQP